MSRKTLRVAAVVVSLCFILAIAPALNSAEKRPVNPSPSFLLLLKKPIFFLGSLLNLFPYNPVLYGTGSDLRGTAPYNNSNSGKGKIKTTGDDNATPIKDKD